jgi:alkylated DNA repair dioxygenase AlkB
LSSFREGQTDENQIRRNCGITARTLLIRIMATRFADPAELPEGFLYRENFLSEDEEAELLRIFRGLEFAPYDYHGYIAKRRIVRYGTNYDLNTRAASEESRPIPEFLLPIRERAAEVASIVPDEMVQAMVSEYSVGTPIGWHRDAPQFGTILGISLGSACRLRLMPYKEAGKIMSLKLEPRSIYVMRGAARSSFVHSIPAVKELRYSITFRTLAKKTLVERGSGETAA